jgi:cobalt-zinc-cadmium efflux system outer membrane protein
MKRALSLAACAVVSACVSSSIGSDVKRVRNLAHVERVARVADEAVDPVSAEDAKKLLEQPLDAERAVRVALLNNRELRATLRELGIARGQLMQAGLLPNPTAELEFLPERNTSLELRVEYDLTGALLAPLKQRSLAPELEAARYRTASALVELGYHVRVAFYDLQAAQQRLALAQQMLDALAAARDAAAAMHQAGNIRELDLASQEAAYERGRVIALELELELLDQREHLQRLLGLHGSDTLWTVQDNLPPAPDDAAVPDDLETRALRASLPLQATRQRLEGLGKQAGYARTSGWLPDVSVDLHGLEGNPDSTSGSNQHFRFGAGVQFGIPLFDRHQGAVTALQAEFAAQLERYYGMAIDLRSLARETRNHVHSSHVRAQHYRQRIVPAQKRVTEQSVLQYNAMQLGIFQLLEVRREQLVVELAEVNALRDYWTAMARLHALLAGASVAQEHGDTRASVELTSSRTTEEH